MSKVEIAGHKELLEDVLSELQQSGSLQIDPNTAGFIKKEDRAYIESFLPDDKTLSERVFLEDIRSKIMELFSCLPFIPSKRSYIEPRPIIDTIYNNLQGHLAMCRELTERRDRLQKEIDEVNRYTAFLDAVEPLLKDVKETPDVDFIGLILKNMDSLKVLSTFLRRQTDEKFEILTAPLSDGSLAGLIVVAKPLAENIKRGLGDRDIPELSFPPSCAGLTFPEKLSCLRKRSSEILDELDAVSMQMDSFAGKWGSIYRKTLEWVNGRLAVLKAAGSVFESEMCFFIYGWMASAEVNTLKQKLEQQFSGRVFLEELELREEDFERIPVMLKNPAYFKPFELFTKLLPLPRYTSYDPTPFIAVFLPVFFGMILGDAGYGLVLMTASYFLYRKFRDREYMRDAAKILFLSAAYAVVFGVIYGEYFGDLGHTLFGLKPLFVERRTAVIPMLYFAITVGVVHVLLGSALGLISAMKKKEKKHALARVLQIAMIMFLLSLVASLFGLFPRLLTRPLILTILFFTPFLLFTGGILAPLELIKSIGNIISYARIMAIGLTSVLLAFVANRLAGMTGDIVIGIFVAGFLHLLNIVIGVFSPAIHSLRLHYVEFFSKFIEPGGRRFEPLKKEEEEEILWKSKKFF
ncbi:MAG: ATPase [Nitrospiraceae bacterium]|nr:MAG: ATPase [Nitrospiraceae bacterium]